MASYSQFRSSSSSAVNFLPLVLLIAFCVFSASLQLAAADGANFGPYLDVYPPVEGDIRDNDHQFSCVPSPNKSCPLYIALSVSFGDEFLSSGVTASIQYALDQINNDSSLLPGYSLHYTVTDSQCNRSVSLAAFHTQIFNPPTKIAVIGSGCSIATEPTAEISHFYNLTQISCVSSSPALSNRIRYPSYFQLLTPDDILADGFLAIIKHFKWERVALIIQEENLFTRNMERLKKELDLIHVAYSEKSFKSSEGVESLGDNPFDPEARIFVVATYSRRARFLMCKAYKHKIQYPQHLFLFYGWYDNNWWIGTAESQKDLQKIYPSCTPEQRASVVRYSLAPALAEQLRDQNQSTVTTSGINGTIFRQEYARYLRNVSRFQLSESVYSEQCYDATWTLAYALNDTLTDIKREYSAEQTARSCSAGLTINNTLFGLQHFLYNNSQIKQKVMGHLEETNFLGITGEVKFDRSYGVRRVRKIVVFSYQPCNGSETCEGINTTQIGIATRNNETVLLDFTTTENIWGAAGVPYDGVPKNVKVTVNLPLAISLICLGGIGVTFAATCLLFNFVFRKKPLIRLTSPNLNYLIGFGAIILYVDISLSVVPSTDAIIVTTLCNLTPWLFSIGYSLCFGTIVAKMCRVYYIFNNPTPSKKLTIHDWILALLVLLLVGIDVIILTIFVVIEGVRGRLGAREVPDREVPESITGELMIINRYFIVICRSQSRAIALGVLYGYKALLQVIAILFAFSTRKVKVKGLDDAKYIAIAVYITSIVTVVIIVGTYTLYDYRNAFPLVICSGIFVGTTAILMLVFIPKMVALHKDPEGTTTFSRQKASSSAYSRSRNLSLQPRHTQDHSTTTEVDSLKKRVNELESTLATMQEEP